MLAIRTTTLTLVLSASLALAAATSAQAETIVSSSPSTTQIRQASAVSNGVPSFEGSTFRPAVTPTSDEINSGYSFIDGARWVSYKAGERTNYNPRWTEYRVAFDLPAESADVIELQYLVDDRASASINGQALPCRSCSAYMALETVVLPSSALKATGNELRFVVQNLDPDVGGLIFDVSTSRTTPFLTSSEGVAQVRPATSVTNDVPSFAGSTFQPAVSTSSGRTHGSYAFLGDADWVSLRADDELNYNPEWTEYRAVFDLPDAPLSVVELRYFADDRATASVNGEALDCSFCPRVYMGLQSISIPVERLKPTGNEVRFVVQNDVSEVGGLTFELRSTAPVPRLAAPITVSGPRLIDATLTAAAEWTNGPTSFAYQWLRCTTTSIASCTPLSGATAATRTLIEADHGKLLRMRVTATNAVGTTRETSDPAGPIKGHEPQLTAPIEVRGLAEVDGTLTGEGTWSYAPTSFTYQWFRCTTTDTASCTAIARATRRSRKVTADDQGAFLRVRIAATNADGTTSRLSAPRGRVVGPRPQLVAPGITIDGTRTVGSTLTASATWTGEPTTFTYRWKRCTTTELSTCNTLRGATSPTRVLHANDRGRYLRMTVAATNTTATVTRTSAPAGPIG